MLLHHCCMSPAAGLPCCPKACSFQDELVCLPAQCAAVTAQAERDSLAGLSEVLTSHTPNLISTGHSDWYAEPDPPVDQQPQHPGLTHLRKRLGLPLQQSLHQEPEPQRSEAAELPQQEAADEGDGKSSESECFAECAFQVSQEDAQQGEQRANKLHSSFMAHCFCNLCCFA